MLKAIAALLFLASACVGQSSADGFFVVRNLKQSDDLLTPAQMREAERLYLNACAVVQHDFHGNGELRPDSPCSWEWNEMRSTAKLKSG